MRITTMSMLATMMVAGCGEKDGVEPGPGGNMPAYCQESGRLTVADTSVAAEGFAFAAADAIAAQSGTFSGDLSGESSSVAVVLTLEVTRVDAVSSVLVDPGGDDTGVAMGAPDVGDCPPAYELAISGTFVAADGSLNESFQTVSRVFEPASGSFTGSILVDDVVGSSRPSFDASEWDSIALQVDGFLQDGAWGGSVSWMASRDTSGDEDITYDSDGVGTGTIQPSGESEAVGSFTLVR